MNRGMKRGDRDDDDDDDDMVAHTRKPFRSFEYFLLPR